MLNKKQQENILHESQGDLLFSVSNFLKQIYVLVKPGVISLVIFTALCAMLLAPSDKSLFVKAICLVMIAMGASGSAILNMWNDRVIDSKMERTKFRPIPSGDINPNWFSIFFLFCRWHIFLWKSEIFFVARLYNSLLFCVLHYVS